MVTRVLTVGTFDIPHVGHSNIIKHCLKYGDEIFIGINSDDFVKNYKGKKPIFNEIERSCFMHDAVPFLIGKKITTFIHTDNFIENLKEYNIDIIVIGNDWLTKDYLKQIKVTVDQLQELDISIIFVPYTKGISTTEIKKRLSE